MSPGSMLCPQCGKLIGVSEEKCPFCGAWQPGMFGAAPKLQRLFGGRLDLIPPIVATCIALYVAALVLQPDAIFARFSLFNFLSPGNRALYQLGMTGGAAWNRGWWWTLLSAIYLHGSLLHIFFNLMWVRDLGPAVSRTYGPARAFVIFSVAGALGFLISNFASAAFSPNGVASPTIGASGSIFGLLAALIVYARRTGENMMKLQLYQWALIMFVIGFIPGTNVNNWAHAGGFIGGWVSAHVMPALHEKRESPAVQVAAIVLIVATAGAFVMSFVTVTGLLLGGG